MAEKKVIELEIKTESVKSLKAQLKEAQADVAALSEKFGATSQEAVNAAKKAAQLKDAIGDAKDLTDAFNPDAKFNALSSSIGGVLNGFQAFEGALGLIGVESEGVQKALLQVQSAMALSQGIQGLMEAKDSFVQLKAVIGQTALGQKALAIGTNLASVAMKAFNVVLKANPIGIVITAITALVGAIAFFTRETGNAKEAAEEYTRALENQRRAIDDNFNALEKRQKDRIDLMKAQGASEQQIFEQEQKNTKKLAEEKQKAHVKEKFSYQNLRRLYKQLMDQGNEEEAAAIREQLKTSRERYNELSKQSKDYYHQLAIDNKINVAENAQKVKENAEKVRQNAIEVQKQQREDAREAAKKREEDRKEAANKEKAEKEKAAEEEKARLKAIYEAEVKANEERLKHQEDVYNLEISLIKDAREREIQELVNSYDAKFEVANGNAELEKQLTEQLNSDIAGINKKYADEDAKIKEEQKAKNREDDEKELQRVKELNAAKLDAVQNGLSTISNLAELFAGKNEKAAKKAFEVQKAVNIAQATIDTYKAATGAFSSLSAIPVVGPVLGAVAAAAAIAAGVVNIKKIASTKFEGASMPTASSAPSGGGGSSMGAAGSTSAITPNFNIVGNAQATNPLAGLGNQPIQAYVVSGEVTTAQNLDRNRINYATFG